LPLGQTKIPSSTAPSQLLQHELVIAGARVAFDFGVHAHELGERWAEQPARDRAEASHGDAATLTALRGLRHALPFLQSLERAPHEREEARAERSQRDTPAAREQGATELHLECLNARAERGLPDIERQRRAAEGAFANHPLKRDQLVRIHRLFRYHVSLTSS
jgi:hypothetical protein